MTGEWGRFGGGAREGWEYSQHQPYGRTENDETVIVYGSFGIPLSRRRRRPPSLPRSTNPYPVVHLHLPFVLRRSLLRTPTCLPSQVPCSSPPPSSPSFDAAATTTRTTLRWLENVEAVESGGYDPPRPRRGLPPLLSSRPLWLPSSLGLFAPAPENGSLVVLLFAVAEEDKTTAKNNRETVENCGNEIVKIVAKYFRKIIEKLLYKNHQVVVESCFQK